jgi:hypothetical protein
MLELCCKNRWCVGPHPPPVTGKKSGNVEEAGMFQESDRTVNIPGTFYLNSGV